MLISIVRDENLVYVELCKCGNQKISQYYIILFMYVYLNANLLVEAIEYVITYTHNQNHCDALYEY